MSGQDIGFPIFEDANGNRSSYDYDSDDDSDDDSCGDYEYEVWDAEEWLRQSKLSAFVEYKPNSKVVDFNKTVTWIEVEARGSHVVVDDIEDYLTKRFDEEEVDYE